MCAQNAGPAWFAAWFFFMSVPSRSSRVLSSLGGLFFGLVIAAAGGLFVWLMWRSYQRAAHMEGWRALPCVILESRVVEEVLVPNTPVSYRPIIRYRYEHEGRPMESDRVQRVAPKASRPDKMNELTARFPAGAEAACYQDPADPGMVVLVKDKPTAVYSIWFPALFVVGGLGIAASSLARGIRSAQRGKLPGTNAA